LKEVDALGRVLKVIRLTKGFSFCLSGKTEFQVSNSLDQQQQVVVLPDLSIFPLIGIALQGLEELGEHVREPFRRQKEREGPPNYRTSSLNPSSI
jgi:hypothetical protein